MTCEFSNRIKELRKKHRYTQIEAAEKIGISDKQISDYELARTEPDIKTLIKIANFYNVSLDYLLGRIEKSQDISKSNFKSPYKITKEFKQIINIIDGLDHKQLGYVLGVLIAVVGKEVIENVD